MRFPDGSTYIALSGLETRDLRRLIDRQERAEGYLTDAELDVVRRARAAGLPSGERLYPGHEALRRAI